MASDTYKFFQENGYLVIPGLFTKDEVARYTELYESDRDNFARMWPGSGLHQSINCDALISAPDIDELLRHPKLLAIIEELMGGPVCLGEVCLRHMAAYEGELRRGWHRDKPHWKEHPLRMDYIQLMLYLSDVHEGTHCFSMSPESADAPILEIEPQLERNGIVDFHGPPGTAVLFNVSCLHTATVRETVAERKSIQIYYGHRGRPYLSNCTVIDECWWRDHPDPEARGFYNMLNRKTRRYLKEKEKGNLQDLESRLDWCLYYDKELKRGDNNARPEGDKEDAPAAGGNEHGVLGE
ncbi:MAG: phytanoyl-CoA dioxygenase family protein [Planctomycetota bacterium]|nr:phytanoyl-CoA dioxygenase family protein [Planctomycetota bacterium]